MSFINNIKNKNAVYKLNIIASYFKNKETVLDFGCGDLLLSKTLKRYNKNLTVTGVDVVDFGDRPSDINFIKYNGQKLPFKNNSFDTVLAFHVLHHCPDPESSFKECVRVARKRLVIIEPVYRPAWEIPIMKFMDWIYNAWKELSIDMNFKFLSRELWHKLFAKYNLVLDREIDIDKYPTWIPVGRGYVFVLKKA